MADEPKKTVEGDGTGTPGKEDPPKKGEISKEDIDKAFDAGLAKGAAKGEKVGVEGFLKELGVENTDALKKLLADGKAAIEKLDTTKTEAEKAIETLREDYDRKFTEHAAKTDPVLKEAAEFVAEIKQEKALDQLKVKDKELLKAFMKLDPPQDGETFEAHAKRVIESRKEKYPDLVDVGQRVPSLPVDDQVEAQKSRMDKIAEKIHQYRGKPTEDNK